MHISFKHHDSLRLFVEIAQCGSFSEAADRLNMTKGAISYQIKVLEDDLGVELFTRGARGVALTEIGRQLLEASRDNYRTISKLKFAHSKPVLGRR